MNNHKLFRHWRSRRTRLWMAVSKWH